MRGTELGNDIQDVHKHMVGLGLGALAHANWHANFRCPENEYWAELSALQAAHAGEILIKARIAQEHPLLIFEHLPKQQPGEAPLTKENLIQNGRTYQFMDLPDRLWATTGIRLPAIERYRSFGRLRNSIQHFTAPHDVDVGIEACCFIYEVIDPFIHTCWNLFAVDYNEDSESYLYLVANLIQKGIPFLVSPDVVENLEATDQDWPPTNPQYRTQMEARFAAAGAHKQKGKWVA